MLNRRIAIYRMENNSILGDCLVIVYHATPQEKEKNGLTGDDIVIFIKTPKSISDLNTVEKIRNSELFENDKSVILRVSSECQFGVFGDSHCDCESQRNASLETIAKHGQGIYIQLPQEGQGRGLFYKTKELQLQVNGIDPNGKNVGKKDIYDAAKILLGHSNIDIRKFTILGKLFKELDLLKYHYILLGLNPSKMQNLVNQTGLIIDSQFDADRSITIDNVGEYLAKIYKKNFSIDDKILHEIYNTLFSAKDIPKRTVLLIEHISDDLENGKEFPVNKAILSKIISLCVSRNSRKRMNLLNLAQGDTYNEYHIEIALDEYSIKKIFDEKLLDGLSDFAFEQNYYYDLVYFKDAITRDLKIRRRSKVGGNQQLIESRLVYKTQASTDQDQYLIRNIVINETEVADLLANSLEGYQVHYVPVFVHTCSYSADESLFILLKQYSSKLITMSIMGKKNAVRRLIAKLEKIIQINIVPSPTNYRTLNKNLSLDFDYDSMAEYGLNLFKKYYRG